jgi:hypothetical protein
MKRKTIITLMSRHLFWTVFIVIFSSSCKKENNLTNKDELSIQDEKLYQAIINGGVKPQDIKDVNDYYLVEGDILFKKNATDISKVTAYFKSGTSQSAIIELIQSNGNGGNGKISSANIPGSISQWQTHNLISSVNVENIKVNTIASPWSEASMNAINNWKNIPNCKINFYNVWEVTSSDANSITFVAAGGDSDVANAYAVAEFPSSGQVGYRIRINTAYNNSLSASQKTFILSHEIGHCIGLRHTNWQVAEYQEPNGALLIPGTPFTDASSIMNRGGAPTVPNWSGFSYYDIVAAQTLYPYGPYDQWLNDIPYFSGYNEDLPPPVTWNLGLVSTPTVSLELFQYGISKGVVAANIPNNGSYTIDYRSYLTTQGHNWTNVQVKIISDSNPGISDISPLFYFYWD